MLGFVERVWHAVWNFFRSNLLAGLFIAVPFGITVAVLIWVWDYIDGPLSQIFNFATQPGLSPWTRITTAIKASQYSDAFVPLVSLGLVLVAVLVLGILARSIIGRIMLQSVEKLVGHLPVIGLLYTSMRQFGETLGGADSKSRFKRAVLVQFPYRGCWAIGFVTGRAEFLVPQPLPGGELPGERLSLFIPTTPLPTAGFMVVVPEAETIPLNMSVQEAFRLVVSGGMLGPGDKGKTQIHLPAIFDSSAGRPTAGDNAPADSPSAEIP